MFGIYRHLDFVNKGNKKIAYSQTILHFSLSFGGIMIFTAIPAQLNSNASLAVMDANGQKLNSGDTVAYGSTGFSIK